jgi:hypothetical protein
MTRLPSLPSPRARRTTQGTGANWKNAMRWAAYTVQVDWADYHGVWEVERVRVYPPSCPEAWLQWDTSYEGNRTGSSRYFWMGESQSSASGQQALKELASGFALLHSVLGRPKGITFTQKEVDRARQAVVDREQKVTVPTVATEMELDAGTLRRRIAEGKVRL